MFNVFKNTGIEHYILKNSKDSQGTFPKTITTFTKIKSSTMIMFFTEHNIQPILVSINMIKL